MKMEVYKNSGFSIIELVLIIVIIGLLSISVFIKWPGLVINLGAQAEQLANDIRYTQSLSMTNGQRYRLVIASSNTYQILNNSGTAIKLAMGNSTMTLNSGITFGTLTNLPNNLIAFDGNGIPYTDTGNPGTQLSATATIPLVGSGNTKNVSISPQTGRTIVQ